MLTHDQLIHFSKKGWVLQPDVFSSDEINRFQQAFDEHIDQHKEAALNTDDTIRTIQFIMNYDQRFRECLMAPQILEENRQITGTDLKYITSWMISRNPAPDRLTNAKSLLRPDKQGWHRDLRPRWGIFPHETDDELINSIYNNSLVLLTDVGEDDGGTLMMDGSHTREGSWQELIETCPITQLRGKAGSVIYFSETLMHSGVPVLSEKRRDVLFVAYAPPWFKTWYRSDVPPDVLNQIEDETQRNILEGWDVFGYMGQYPVDSSTD